MGNSFLVARQAGLATINKKSKIMTDCILGIKCNGVSMKIDTLVIDCKNTICSIFE